MVPRPAGMMLPGAMMPQPGQVLVLAPGQELTLLHGC